MNFSAQDDFQLDRRKKRKRCYLITISLLLVLIIGIGVILNTFPSFNSIRNKKSGQKPSNTSNKGIVQFYVVSDTPHNPADVTKLQRDMSNLDPDKGSFLFHLGDVIAGDDTLCTRGSYREAASVLKTSPVPVVLLPGNEDWNDCPNPRDAFDNWMMHLNRFEENFEDGSVSQYVVERHLARDENFAILLDDVLVIGVHMVNGNIPSQRDWDLRQQDNVQWVEEQLSHQWSIAEDSNKAPFRAVVILGHAPATSSVGDFFWSVQRDLVKEGVPVVYLHANYDGKKGVVQYIPFEKSLPTMKAVQIPVGSVDGILRVKVDYGPNPFKFETL